MLGWLLLLTVVVLVPFESVNRLQQVGWLVPLTGAVLPPLGHIWGSALDDFQGRGKDQQARGPDCGHGRAYRDDGRADPEWSVGPLHTGQAVKLFQHYGLYWQAQCRHIVQVHTQYRGILPAGVDYAKK